MKEPVQRLMADLEDEFGPLRTFRPNRDVRFSKDKSPYKTWVGVTTSDRAVGGVGAFLTAQELPVGPGMPPVLKRVPTGYPADHPRGELLRWKGAVVVKDYPLDAWLHQPQAIDAAREILDRSRTSGRARHRAADLVTP